MQAFFCNEAAETYEARLKEKSMFESRKNANTFFGLAFGKRMKTGCGMETLVFKPKHRLKPLEVGDVRYVKDVDTPSGNKRRFCIENEITKKRRLEYPSVTVDAKIHEPTM